MRGALNTEVIMFINDLHEHCGSGRLGSSRHVWVIVTDWRHKVCKGFAVFSAKLARAPSRNLGCRDSTASNTPLEIARCADSMMARERMLPRTGRMYRCNGPVHLMKRNFPPLRRGEFRGIVSVPRSVN